jgi:uncharacterized RDD family membrane protein YckC
MALNLLIRRLAAWILDELVCVLLLLLLAREVLRPFLLEIARNYYHQPGPFDPRELWAAMGPGEKSVVLSFFVIGTWFIIPSLYYAFFESSRLQATPGKRLLDLVVTRIDGTPISWWRASARFWGRVLCGPVGFASVITMLVSARHQALHDMIAGCTVRLRTNAGAGHGDHVTDWTGATSLTGPE